LSVKIRLMRVGKKKQPAYRVVVADARSPRDGRIIDSIGRYLPRAEPSLVEIDGERALDWLRKGAQPTEQALKLLAASGVWARYESERGGPVTTKLSRRGVTPGVSPPPPKPAPRPTPPEPAPPAEAETPSPGEAEAETAAAGAGEAEAETPAAGDDAAEAETPAGDDAGEPATEEAAP
jgi:small subunit ribosomal protein S16